jgi:hypothetical protein
MIEMTTIYMPLLNDGTTVWRPIGAERLSQNTYRVKGPMPDDEKWAFAPGSVVTVVPQLFADGSSGIVAVAMST